MVLINGGPLIKDVPFVSSKAPEKAVFSLSFSWPGNALSDLPEFKLKGPISLAHFHERAEAFFIASLEWFDDLEEAPIGG